MKTNNPGSTYRIQFNYEFTFRGFEDVINYLQQLGVQTIYASPIFQSVPGSNHGYDGINPLQIDPAIGNVEQLKNISGQLRQYGMGWLQDIVPNHMAFHFDNKWLTDVLEKKERSAYFSFFDIDWENSCCEGKLMAPFLGKPIDEAIESGEIKLAFNSEKIVLKYFDHSFPLNLTACQLILRQAEHCHPRIADLMMEMERMTQINDGRLYATRWGQFLTSLRILWNERQAGACLDHCLEKINTDHRLLGDVANQQYYRLCQWTEANQKINYRRFFTINGLICLNIQDKLVFDHYHQFVEEMVKGGIFQGLRVDHIDGLYDPTHYLQRLRGMAGRQTYLVVEKILQPDEPLPGNWSVQGTTGYEFLGLANNLFTNKKNQSLFSEFYAHLISDAQTVEQQVYEKKSQILFRHMGGEMDNLLTLLVEIIGRRQLAGVDPDELKKAIAEFLIRCPVYRYYGNKFPLHADEAAAIENIFKTIRHSAVVDKRAVELLKSLILDGFAKMKGQGKNKLIHFYKRCMQFTGPLMAKGVEDTLMYTYNRFIAHNDVGDSPANFGIDANEFHQAMIARQKQWPLCINTTSTHDTKRGEDVRARLNVLSDVPHEWFQHVEWWKKMNCQQKQRGIPDNNEEYFIYQSLLGAYPMPGVEDVNFEERLTQYLQKALREAEVNSQWDKPNDDYERAVCEFAASLLDEEKAFWQDFEPFHRRIADFGIVNSLSQVALKFTCPGVPDLYQGSELWDLSFVDPDNRRPVDYRLRSAFLGPMGGEANRERLMQRLWDERSTGQVKLWLTHILLILRKQDPEFFARAEYIPLQVRGVHSNFVFAFARRLNENCLVVAVPLHAAELCSAQGVRDFGAIDWGNTHIMIPWSGQKFLEVLQGNNQEVNGDLPVQELFKTLPIYLLQSV